MDIIYASDIWIIIVSFHKINPFYKISLCLIKLVKVNLLYNSAHFPE
jgi:hypothetical protein